MKIKLLGTAAFEGMPGLFCSCDICKESIALGGRNIRKRSSALIDNKIMLDFTNDALSHVIDYGLDLSVLEHLFISHSHSDHFNYYDLEAKLRWYTNSGNPVLNVYANKNCIDLISTFLAAEGDISEYLSFKVLEPYSKIQVEGYTITGIPARHITSFKDERALLYIIENRGKKILYGLDSGWYYDETWEYLKSVYLDCVILDCTCGFLQVPVGNHMGLNDNINVMKKMKDEGIIDASTKAISTHFSHNGKVIYDRHHEEFAKHGLIMSYDGMDIDI